MQTVGELLRLERERKKLTLKDVEASTNIRSAYLSAIENGNYSALPGETYVKGFIRNYANALGLNGSEYVDLYRNEQRPVEEGVIPQKEEKTPSSPTASSTTEADPAPTSTSSTSKWIVLALIVLIGGGGAWWYMSPKESSTPPPQAPKQSQPAPVQPQPQTSVVPPALPTQPVAKSVVIAAKFNSRSWVQVLADEKEVFEGIPQIGTSMTWQADQKITIKVGNAAAVDLSHNGQPVGKLGESGEVVLKTFTAAGR